MKEVVFYRDKNGKNEIEEYLVKLQGKQDKDSKIKANKIIAYIDILVDYGVSIGEPYVKHLQKEIWELRTNRNRILFASINDNKFILLTIFMKTTQKTPKREIERAEIYLKDFKKRNEKNGR